MKKLLIVRRRRLGHSTCKALSELLGDLGIRCGIWRKDRTFPAEFLSRSEMEWTGLRWGCTSTVTIPTTRICETSTTRVGSMLNKAGGIHKVAYKKNFLVQLQTLMEGQSGLLPLVTGDQHLQSMSAQTLAQRYDRPTPTQHQVSIIEQTCGFNDTLSSRSDWVVRPATHSQGRNLSVIPSSQVQSHPYLLQGGYARPLIQKKSEYRVYVMNGRVVNVAQKTPANPADVAWNVNQGGRFDNVRFGDWPLKVCDLACRVFKHTGLTMSGIDIMVDQEDEPWFIEANSAPSLPYNSDGSHTYRQKCVAKGLHYTLTESGDQMETDTTTGWRGYVHPAVWSPQGEEV